MNKRNNENNQGVGMMMIMEGKCNACQYLKGCNSWVHDRQTYIEPKYGTFYSNNKERVRNFSLVLWL